MKKYTIILAVILAFLCGTTVLAENPKGQPFKAIWEAIESLQEQINNIVLQPGPQGPVGPCGPVGPRGNTGEHGTSGIQLRVVDGSNQDLGILINAQIQTNYFITYNESLGAVMRFYDDITRGSEDNPTKFVPNIATIHFDQPNCAGTPFAGIDNRNPQGVFTMDDLRTLPFYMFTDDETPAIKMSRSRSNTPSNPCHNFTNPVPVEYAVTLQEITLPFSEPLTWPLTIDRL